MFQVITILIFNVIHYIFKERKRKKTLGVFDFIYFGSALHVIYVMINCLGESVNQIFVNDKTNI